MYRVFIISTGTELTLGETEDSNGHYLSRQLSELGYEVIGRVTVSDDYKLITQAFAMARDLADVIISSGGMGPTLDDLTREAAYEVGGVTPILSPKALAHVENYFAARKVAMPDINRKQALIPEDALILDNNWGTAPGVLFTAQDKTFMLLPGPPRELKPMFNESVKPWLQQKATGNLNHVRSVVIKSFGAGESPVEKLLAPFLQEYPQIKVALLAVEGEVHVRLTAEREEETLLNQEFDQAVNKAVNCLGNNFYGFNEQSLSQVVGELLASRGQTVSLAESCTGGLASKLLTDNPGSSAYYWGGAVTYSNFAKNHWLHIPADLIDQYGAVSPQVAEAMAIGVRSEGRTDYGIGITGIAGPGGGSDHKPVGLVYIALADRNNCSSKELHFKGGREAVRMLSAKSALDWLRRRLGENQ
ncbi:MAG: competence/damage-inducible protein A [Methylocystaceae bacterium]